jgi:hypothetical protein
MRLAIITKAGMPISRDVALEIIRRAAEKGGDFKVAFEELEAEYDAYAVSLLKDQQYGGEVK